MNIEDLKELQKQDLNRKIMITQTKILEFYKINNGNICLNFSGGLDSTVLLDVITNMGFDKIYFKKPVRIVHLDTGLEHKGVYEFVRTKRNVEIIKPNICGINCVNCEEGCFGKLNKKYGWCFPSKNVSHSLYYAKKGSKWALNMFNGVNNDGSESYFKKTRFVPWKNLLETDMLFSDKCCHYLKEKPLDDYIKSEGLFPIIGTRADESHRRTQSWIKSGGCNKYDGKQSKPLSFWKEQDILQYITKYNIEYAKETYGDIVCVKGKLTTTKEKRTGCSVCPAGCHLERKSKYIRMKTENPEMYDYAINKLNLKQLLDYVGVEY